MDPKSIVEKIYDLCGVNNPEDIDPEAIAHFCDLGVRYVNFTMVRYQLIHYKNNAEVLISDMLNEKQKRFEIFRALAEWSLGGNNRLVSVKPGSSNNIDEIAMEFLMPTKMFLPYIKNIKAPTFDDIIEQSTKFDRNNSEICDRFIDLSPNELCLVNYQPNGNPLYKKTIKWPPRLKPKKSPKHFLKFKKKNRVKNKSKYYWAFHYFIGKNSNNTLMKMFSFVNSENESSNNSYLISMYSDPNNLNYSSRQYMSETRQKKLKDIVKSLPNRIGLKIQKWFYRFQVNRH